MRMWRLAAIGVTVSAVWPLVAQTQVSYTGANVTGQLVLSRTVNALQLAQSSPMLQSFRTFGKPKEIAPYRVTKRLRPPHSNMRLFAFGSPMVKTLQIASSPGTFGFDGLTHLDQREANNGNQFSVEPPNPSIAVADGYILVGVNNAVQVYTETGTALLPKVLSTNELFGVAPAIDRVTGLNGVFPTDMRVFFDQTIRRWFVLQRAQDYDVDGNPVAKSHLYIAVSQTSDPIADYNIYTMETTDAQNPGCPCVADYPQIGSDDYGFYVSSNEFNTFSESFVNAQIHAISKSSLASGAIAPTMYRFVLPFTTGYEFAIQPATTPPGARSFLANGGLEYFVSSNASFSIGSGLTIWAMYNTSSLGTASPNLSLTQITVPTLTYVFPDVATQRPGPLPYGSSLFPPGPLPYIDGGDTRVLSVSYAGGRLYATLATGVADETGRNHVGGAWVIFSPTFRGGILAAPVLRQGYLAAPNNDLLRPAIAVNPQGRGAIAFTLTGPDYYPSAAFVTIDTFSTGTAVRLVQEGAFPEDGFTGYTGGFGAGVARWGDYSAAVATSAGTIWMAMQYIPDAPRTEFANWGTFLVRHVP